MICSRLLVATLLLSPAARAQDTVAVRACDQPATGKIDAAFYGQVAAIPAADSSAVGPAYLDNLLEAVRESLHPGPLPLSEYLVWPGRAMLAAQMTVVFTVTHDGQVRDIGLASSSLSSAFDHMILDAIHTADTSGLMPPLPSRAPSHVVFALSVYTSPFLLQASAPMFKRSGHVQPLLKTSLPSWTGRVTPARADSGPPPKYPPLEQLANRRDSIEIRYVLDENGRIVPASVFVVAGRYVDFATSVREWMPTAKYQPARIGTCAVKSIEQQAFVYKLH